MEMPHIQGMLDRVTWCDGVFIVPLKYIEYGLECIIKIPIYPVFYLLKGDYRFWGSR